MGLHTICFPAIMKEEIFIELVEKDCFHIGTPYKSEVYKASRCITRSLPPLFNL